MAVERYIAMASCGGEDSDAKASSVGHHCTRLLLSVVLIAAALLKSVAATSGQSAFLAELHPVVIGGEVLLACWLLSQRAITAAWYTAMCCFAVFAGVSMYLALLGRSSCGCLGNVPVGPWSMLTFDVLALTALAAWPPLAVLSHSPSRWRPLGGTLLVLAVTGAATAAHISEKLDKRITFEVDQWIGKPLPFREDIAIDAELDRDAWMIVFHDPDCPKCQEILPQYRQLAEDLAGQSDAPRVALIDISKQTSEPDSRESETHYVSGVLQHAQRWLIETPTEILLIDGIVSSGPPLW